jgi:Fibrobacter succinogenes major domain (Fib_succ_major).
VNFKFPVGIFAVFSVFVLMFSACGDDSGNSASDELPESVEQFSDIKSIECNADRECAQIYIEEHDDYVQCIDSKWETVIASKPNKACAEAKSSSSKNKSSSSMGYSSSSRKTQSSSSGKLGLDESEYDAQKNTLTDYRDNTTYSTVTIGNQIWMARNLNYDNGIGYKCGYGENRSNQGGSCARYGKLYTWDFAKTACPKGWHLPDSSEWMTLINYAGGAEKAGIKLRARTNNRWDNSTDNYDFSALPAGAYNSETGRYSSAGYIACFWSSSEIDSSQAFEVQLNWSYDKALSHASSKIWGCSVRCIKDED